MRTVFITLLALSLAVMQLQGQDVVVSEYRNESQAGNEWTELLVIKDNCDIRGWILRDYAGSTPPPTQLIGGVRFKDDPLWVNLRAGTIIVINHRTCSSPDFEKRDGYIELGAYDTAYLDTICTNCSLSWAIQAMSIAANSDMMELVDQNGNPVHCLAHMPTLGGAFAALNASKAAFAGSISSGQSIAILPGVDLNAYLCGFDSGYANTDTTYILTKGKPNNSSRRMNLNQAFWRSLREPAWNSPAFIKFTVDKDKTELEWNKCTDPNPSDGSTGYLLVRYESKDSASISAPIDGKIYYAGDYLSRGIVLYSGSENKFTDSYSIRCGDSYDYVVYAWRFSKDDKNEDGSFLNARGRSYNESIYAKIVISKPDINTPVIGSSRGILKYCLGDSLILRCLNEKYDSYEWLKDNIVIKTGCDSLIVRQSGAYRLRVSGSYGCIKLSNELDIREVNQPIPRLTLESPKPMLISGDTSLSFCKNANIQLRIYGGEVYQWYKDGTEITGATSQFYMPTQPGVYYAELINGEICTTQSHKIDIRIREINLKADNENLDFTITDGSNFMDRKIFLENLSNEDITINPADININSDFSIVGPALPWVLIRNQKFAVTVRFTPTQTKVLSGQLLVNLPCNELVKISLTGTKISSGLVTDISSVNFNNLNICSDFPADSSINITNTGNFDLIISDAIINPPFYSKAPVYPFTLGIGASQKIEFGIRQSIAGQYAGLLRIAYKTDFHPTSYDTLDISLGAKISDVDYSCTPNILNVGFSNCDIVKDTLILIYNNGETDISIDRNNNNPVIKLLNIPVDIKAGDSAFLQIRLEPASSADLGITYNQELRSVPCGLIRDFAVNLIDYGYEVKFSKDTFNLGTIGYCGGSINVKDSAQISVAGTPSEDITIKEIRYTGNIGPIISTNLVPGLVIKDADIEYFDINLQNTGDYEGDLNLTLSPCDITQVLHFKVGSAPPEYNLLSSNIDFRLVKIGDSTKDTIKFYNKGKMDVLVTELRGLSAPFARDGQNPQLPVSVGPDSVLDVPLMFAPTLPGTYSQTVSLIVGEPCNGFIDINITGIAEGSANEVLRGIAFAPLIKARPGEEINIPIRLAMEPPTEINTIGVAAIELTISYNRKLFDFKSAKPGSSFGTPPNAYVTPQENYPGNMSFMIDQIDPSKIKDGEILVISGTALVGDTISTPIIIDTVIIYSDGITSIQSIDGLLTIDGDCSQNNRNVIVGGQISLSVKSEINRDEITEVEYKLISDEFTSLKLFDMNGNLVHTLDEGFPGKGFHTSVLNTNTLSQGIYLLILRNGFLQRSARILILD